MDRITTDRRCGRECCFALYPRPGEERASPLHTRASEAEFKEGTSGEKTMSWKTINEILGSAILDEAFCLELLEHPLQAVQPRNFELTAEEQDKLRDIKARDLVEFSQMVLAAFDKKE